MMLTKLIVKINKLSAMEIELEEKNQVEINDEMLSFVIQLDF